MIQSEHYKKADQINVVETPYRVDRPIFHDYEVKRPKFVDEPIKVPVGWEEVINTLAEDMAKSVLDKVECLIVERLDRVIDRRLKEIEVPKITVIEETHVVYRDLDVPRAVIRNVPVTNSIITDVQVTNAVIKDVKVLNAVVEDIHVKNAVIENVPVKNLIMSGQVKPNV